MQKAMNKGYCSDLNTISKIIDLPKSSTLSKPLLNSTLRTRNQMDRLQKTKFTHIKLNKNEADLLNKPKLTMKLNFGANQKIFGNLTSINVNDSLMIPKQKYSIPKKYTPNIDRIPTPALHDFLAVLESPIYVIEEPEIEIQINPFCFDVMLNYKLLKD